MLSSEITFQKIKPPTSRRNRDVRRSFAANKYFSAFWRLPVTALMSHDTRRGRAVNLCGESGRCVLSKALFGWL